MKEENDREVGIYVGSGKGLSELGNSEGRNRNDGGDDRQGEGYYLNIIEFHNQAKTEASRNWIMAGIVMMGSGTFTLMKIQASRIHLKKGGRGSV